MFGKRSVRKEKKVEDEDAQRISTISFTSSPGPSRVSAIDSNGSLQPLRLRTSTAASGQQSSKNKVAESGPLGLTVVYTPDNTHKVDIVFVHGLGGASRWTWSKNNNPELFWPLMFLPLETDICLARIMTFGYNSAQKAGGPTLSVRDFAQELLFDLKYAKDQDMKELEVGKVPLIFVAHSMGGLIVKEAYMQGQNYIEYEGIIKAISAITFLATPHRATTLAQTLNRILDTTSISNSKLYVSDLMKNSLTLQNLNEQFRHVAPRLDIVSFYETLPTTSRMQHTQVMVLEKDSSILGYPGEISNALNADHHNICKYDGPQDPNYITVRNVLKSLMSKIISKGSTQKPGPSDRRASLNLKSLLSISDSPVTDYIFFRDLWTQGTNDWIIQDEAFLEWRNAPKSTHRLLWLSGGPATGKSVMSSFLINNLTEGEFLCQYFFITFGDRKKRTLSLLLRSLAYQLALSVPGFLSKIIELVDAGIDFETADPRFIWDRIFKLIVFKWEQRQPLYWIIDGLDEAEDPRAVIKLLSDISSSSVPFRILFTGRRTSEIMTAFERLPQSCGFETISIEGHLDDLRRHVRQELILSGTAEFRGEIERRIVDGSHNNFLWARLAVNKVNQCYTHADVDLALQEVPAGMETIYDRMASSIVNNPNPRDKLLATRILECVTCSLRVLKVVELSYALGGDISEILDLHRAIMDLCGGFVNVDNGGNVAMIHQTARDYLLGNSDEGRPFVIDRQAAHRQLFLSSMRCIMQTGLQAKLNRNQKPEFLEYAASSWSSHLTSAPLYDHEIITTLKKFLTGNWVLTWIHTLAADGQLRVLIRASKDLSRFSLKGIEQGLGMSTEGIPVLELELFENWAVDLLRVVGKFNNLLRRKPDSIYKFIPPLCPKTSSIYQLFGKTEAKNLSVTGLSAETWDDSLARISLGQGESTTFASSITAAGSQIAVLASSGSVFLYDSSDFMGGKSSPIKHGEHVYKMHLNSTATLLATYGHHTTKVWEVSTGKCKVSVESVKSKTRPLDMLFTDNNSTLLVGTDDKTVRSLNLNEAHPAWEVVAELNEQELEEHFIFINSANHMALSKDGSMVAIAYRSHTISAWEIDGSVHIGHCRRKNEAGAIRELHDLVWHPHLPQILALNLEGIVFKWNPYESEIHELPVAATKLSISSNGDLFATGDDYGRVKLYQTSTFSLLYQLASQDAVSGMTFSPDSRRLYDIRGYYANVWQPNALMRLTEESDSDIHSSTPSSEASVVVRSAVDLVTALAGSPKGRIYCYGTEGGVVGLHDTHHGKLGDVKISRAEFTIEKIVWSAEGKYICFADMSRQVTIISVTQGAGEIEHVVRLKPIIPVRKFSKGPILQLLFQPDSSHLLVQTSSQMRIISLTSPSVERSRDLEDIRIQWIIHPADPSLIVGFGTSNTYVFGWDLVQRRKYEISFMRPPDISSSKSNTESPSAYQIDRVLVTHDKRHLFLQMSHPRDHSLSKRFFFFETSAISTSTSIVESHETPAQANEDPPPSIVLHSLPTELSSNIASALSFLSHDRLVFLSKSFAICSIQIPWTSYDEVIPLRPAIQRINTTSSTAMAPGKGGIEEELFALHGDWITRDCLHLCCAWGVERSILCPTSGEVAVVRFDEAHSNEILSQVEPLILMEQDTTNPFLHPQQDSGYGTSLRDNTVSGGLSFVNLGPSGESEFTHGHVSHAYQSEAKDSDEQDPNRDFQEPDYDIHSVVSDRDDLNSQVSNNRSNYGVLAERHLATLLAYNEELRPLYEEALKIVHEERFRNNLRKLLKRFYLDLSLHASSNLEKATIHTFRSNRSRVRIAQQIVDHLLPENQEDPTIPPLNIGLQMDDLEAWIQNTPSLALNQLHRPDASIDVTPLTWDEEPGDIEANKNEMPMENSYLGPESSDNDENEAQTALPSIAEMENFLFQGSSFRNFTLNLRLFLIPASLVSLTRVLTSIPRDRIWFSDNDDLSILNKIKAKFEESTEADWDWWPLEPRRKNLKKNQVRVHWECHCGTQQWTEISKSHAHTYKLLLQTEPSPVSDNHLCKARLAKARHWKLRPWSCLSIRSWMATVPMNTNYSPHQLPVISPVALSNAQGTPQGPPNIAIQANNYISMSNLVSNNPQGAQLDLEIGAANKLYVLFAVQGGRHTLELAQIHISSNTDDGTFFGELKLKYRELRGFWRYWLSIWQMRYCDFVKFRKVDAHRIIFHKRDLPSDLLYDYTPRPPDAEDPPIPPHEFEFALLFCHPHCHLSTLPFHDCVRRRRGTFALDRIPKRKAALEVSMDTIESAWGLQAHFSISAVLVFIYHLLMIAGAIAFWAWWELRHPGDLQNATVPLSVVAVFLSLFWSSTGVLKGTRK